MTRRKFDGHSDRERIVAIDAGTRIVD